MSEEEGRYSIVGPDKIDYLPSRFKSSNVDRFVPVLKAVVEGRPEIRFKHDDLHINATTALARVRDAALAIIRGLAFHPEVDADKLRDVWWLYKVNYDAISREIVIGLKHKDHSAPSQNILDAEIRVDVEDLEEFLTDLAAFARLYGRHRIRGRLTILGMLDDNLKRDFEQKYNVTFNQISPNEHIML
jgi:hypothetical protein